MIHIRIERLRELQDWYAAQLVPVLQRKTCSAYSGGHMAVRRFYSRISVLTEAELRDILLVNRQGLEGKYPWIGEYTRLCDFCAFYAEFRANCRNLARCELVPLRADYLKQYGCCYLDEALDDCGMDAAAAVKIWSRLDEIQKAARKILDKLNAIIRSKIDYAFMGDDVRGELAERLNIPVCPYCNRQYIQPVTIANKKRYLGDIDHILPKSVYQLFALSLWNLTPSCKVCNQLFKGSHVTQLLNPWEAGFNSDCILELKYRDVSAIAGLNDNMDMKWSVMPETDAEARRLIENSLRLFCLDESYSYHKKDIQKRCESGICWSRAGIERA